MKALKTLFFIAILSICSLQVTAQCAMCKTSVENSANNTERLESLNGGILYLITMPFLIFSIAGFVVYKRYKKHQLLKELDSSQS